MTNAPMSTGTAMHLVSTVSPEMNDRRPALSYEESSAELTARLRCRSADHVAQRRSSVSDSRDFMISRTSNFHNAFPPLILGNKNGITITRERYIYCMFVTPKSQKLDKIDFPLPHNLISGASSISAFGKSFENTTPVIVF